MHSYLDGVGLEIMASSDNVIRGGLTPKHVDCAELSRLAKFETLPEELLRVTPQTQGAQSVYPTPVEDFTLALVDVEPTPATYAITSAEVLQGYKNGQVSPWAFRFGSFAFEHDPVIGHMAEPFLHLEKNLLAKVFF